MGVNTEENYLLSELNSAKLRALLKTDMKYTPKSAEKSGAMRIAGNHLYKKTTLSDKDTEDIFAYYTKSISLALPDSKDLALAYGNRSAALLRMHKYRDSVLDINRALIIDSVDWAYNIKLLCRKVECLVALNSTESKSVLEEAKTLLRKEVYNLKDKNSPLFRNLKVAETALNNLVITPERKKKTTKRPEHLDILARKESEDPSETVAMQYNDRIGRYLVANRNIEPGEIVFVEKPYVNCVNFYYSYNYCGHCFKKSWSIIPCDHCNWCMFCSESCKVTAWRNYHDIECNVISYLMHYYQTDHQSFDYFDLLSLRSLIFGIREAGGIANFREDLKSVDEWTDRYEKRREKQEEFSSNGFKSIYSLSCDATAELVKKCAINAATILILLFKYTVLFERNFNEELLEDFTENEDVLFVGTVLMKLRKRTNSSAHIIHSAKSHCKHPENMVSCMVRNCSKGACVSPTISFINHSCDPNVKICMTRDQKIILFALQPIKKNSQLLLPYVPTFYEAIRPLRRSSLKQRFNFVCHCDACSHSWPTLVQMYKLPKENPYNYSKTYNKTESDLYDENDPLVKPIITWHSKAQYNQTTVKRLSKATEKATSLLKQPSVVVCELMTCLDLTFEKLYGSS